MSQQPIDQYFGTEELTTTSTSSENLSDDETTRFDEIVKRSKGDLKNIGQPTVENGRGRGFKRKRKLGVEGGNGVLKMDREPGLSGTGSGIRRKQLFEQSEQLVEESEGRSLRSREDRLRENKYQLESSPIFVETDRVRENGVAVGSSSEPCIIQAGNKTIFVEPELAEPQPGYTGFPLESFPNSKIKKESLWPTKSSGKRGGRGSSMKSEATDLSDALLSNEIDSDTVSVEMGYQNNLKTRISEEIKEESDLREAVQGTKTGKNGRPRHYTKRIVIRTPKQAKPKHSGENNSGRHSKRIKVISPKKPAATNLAPSSTAHSLSTNTNISDDNTRDNDDFCSTCGGPGIFICCDSCTKSFHFACCDPPFEECPEDNWNCKECVARFNPGVLTNWKDIGVFGQLLNQQEGRNPKEFILPKKLRENTFVGVTTSENSVYQDASYKPDIPMNKMNGSQIPGFSKNSDLDIETLYDKKGKPYLCHKCGLSGLNNRTLTHCDYCPLVWHIDCLKDPLGVPKTLGSKWRCPNHVEELIPEGLFTRRRFKDTAVLDASLHSHFLRIASLNNILIKYDNQPYLKTNHERFTSLQAYVQYEADDFARFDTDYIDEALTYDGQQEFNINNTNNGEETNANTKVPDFFDNYSTKVGITAKAGSKLNKILTMTESDGSGKTHAFIYRVPEKLIVLDFLSKVSGNLGPGGQRANANVGMGTGMKKAIMGDVEEYETRGRLETNHDEMEFVESALRIKNSSTTQKPSTVDFDELVKAALDEVGNAEVSSTKDTPETLSKTELDDLIKVKKLIELKGRDSLLKFLQSS